VPDSERGISIIGHSYLGLVAALYARAHPEHVNRIVQIGAMWIDPSETFAPELAASDKDRIPDPSKLKEIQRLYEDGFAERDPQAFCERWWAVVRFTYVTDPEKVDQLPQGICALRNEWPTNQLTYLGNYVMPSIPRMNLKASDFHVLHVPVLGESVGRRAFPGDTPGGSPTVDRGAAARSVAH